ncbi:MAG: membrane protein insertase YidC [candidate division WOR-3 bacterium]|nr:MAG: membrane protein insertase YidC [candidate division WOR-3 bacterium]
MSDRARTALAFGVIIGILLIWTFLNRPAQRTGITEQVAEDTITQQPAVPAEEPAPVTEDTIVIERPRIRVVLSNYGGSVSSFYLKDYEIDIVPPGRRLFVSPLEDSQQDQLHASYTVTDDSVTFRFTHENSMIEKTYHFDNDHGFSIRIASGNSAQILNLRSGLNITETRNPADDMRNFNVYVKNEKLENVTKNIKEAFTYVGKLGWFALRTKYFVLAVDNNAGIDTVWFYKLSEDVEAVEKTSASFGCYYMGGAKNRYGAAIKGRGDIDITVRLMPMDNELLAQYNKGYEEINSGGFWGPISKVIMGILNFMYSILKNYGFAIMIFALLIKLVFFPLSRQMILSQHKMQLVQPELKKIQQKYKDDPQRLNQEMMHLYKTYKVNPLSGCLPLLIQMPIFFALFRTLTTSIEFRQANFLFWITDLSLKDPYYVLPISMGVMMVVQSLTTTIDPRQRLMVIFMPIVMVWIFIGLPSGLQLYWFTYNILTLIEHFVTKRGGLK